MHASSVARTDRPTPRSGCLRNEDAISTTLAINVWAFWVEYRNVSINVDVIEEVLREVDRIRAAHGLPSNAEALQQEQA